MCVSVCVDVNVCMLMYVYVYVSVCMCLQHYFSKNYLKIDHCCQCPGAELAKPLQ